MTATSVFYGVVILILCLMIVYLLFQCWKRPINTAKEPNIDIINKEIKVAEAQKDTLSPDQLFNLAETYHYGRYGFEINLGKALGLYEQCLSLLNHKKMDTGRCYMAMGKLYKDGGAGHVPDGRKAIKYFVKALECGYEDAVIEIGKIYQYGLHPHYLPDKLTAGKIYNRVAYDQRFTDKMRAICSKHSKDISMLGYQDLDNIPEVGREYFTLPYTIVEDVNAAWESCIIRGVEIKPCTSDIVVIQPIFQQPIQINRNYRAAEPDINILDLIPQQKIKSDSQNVHSSTVQNAVQKKLDTIQERGNITSDFERNKADFYMELERRNDITAEERDNAKKVLESLKNSVHSRYNKTESDIFNIVWSRINNPVNRDRRGDMISVLAQNMASGVEHDAVVCSTGKVVRIVGALDGMDAEPLPELKPEWAINEEIALAASKIREEVLSKVGPTEKGAYEAIAPSETQKSIANDLTNKMKDELLAKCETDYVKTGIINSEEMETKVKDYLDSF